MNMTVDIESLPSGDPIDPLSLSPPGNYKKADTISEWYKTEAVTIAAEKYRARALDSMQGEILCIGYAIEDEPVEVIYAGSEKTTLARLEQVVKETMGQWSEPIQFIGWNVKTFDMPFIWRKAIKYGLKALHKSINRDRYRGNILDLMEVWTAEYNKWNSAKDVAAFLGIPNDDPVDGSQVYDLYLEGNIGAIINHCRCDVEMEREIYKRIYG